MNLNMIQHDFYNALNKLFDNKLPPHVQAIKIEGDLENPITITVRYIPDLISGESFAIESKFGLIEYND